MIRKTTLALALAAGLPLPSLAQTEAGQTEAARTIIVMDGSGSMWGQIDGRAKLEIARETVGAVLGRVPRRRRSACWPTATAARAIAATSNWWSRPPPAPPRASARR